MATMWRGTSDLVNALLEARRWSTVTDVLDVDNLIHIEDGTLKWTKNSQKYAKWLGMRPLHKRYVGLLKKKSTMSVKIKSLLLGNK
jgi:hypothetical protein